MDTSGRSEQVTRDGSPRWISAVASHNVFVILNPVAGQSDPDEVRQVLRMAFESVSWPYRIHETTGCDDIPALIDEVRREGADLIVAAGGDGTVSAVANALVGTDLLLGIIPLGTGNVLSLELGIPQTLAEAADLLVSGSETCCLDAMRVGGRNYFLQIGIGLDSLMIRDTSRAAKRRFGRIAYMVTLARTLIGYQSNRLTLEIDGRRHRARGWDVLIANAGTLGTPLLHWSPEICPTDGHLNLVVLEVDSPLDVLKATWRLLLNLPRNEPPLVLYNVYRSCRVATARPAPVQADGEIIGNTPVVVKVVPRAVTVLVAEECPAKTCSMGLREAQGREKARRLQAMLGPWLGPLGLLDTSAALLVNAMPHPPILNMVMHTLAGVMNRGDGWLFGLLLATLQGEASPRDFLRVAVPLSLVNLIVEFGLKHIVQRDRPFRSRVLAPVIGKKPNSHSFPSGHAAASFAAAWLLSQIFAGGKPFFYALASLVAFSRIYLGVHYFTDILAGAASGTVLAAVFGGLMGIRD